MSVYRDKQRGTWFYTFYGVDAVGTKHRYKKRGFETRELAKRAEAAALLSKERAAKTTIKFQTVYDSYILDKEKKAKHRSIYTEKALYKKHILPYFGNKNIFNITPSFIEKWQEKLLKKGYKNAYLSKIQISLSMVFKYAVKKQIIKENPMIYIDRVRNVDEAKTIMQFWTLAEYNRFRSVIDDEVWALLFDVLYWTGLRIGELQALTWNDFRNDHLIINKNFDNKTLKITNTTKTGNNRVVYLDDQLKNALKKHYIYCSKIDGFSKDFFIFGFYKPFSHTNISTRKNRYIELYNATHDVKLNQIRIHDFRHSHVSFLANNGANVWEIADRLGHSKEMVEKRYYHMFPENRKNIVSIINTQK